MIRSVKQFTHLLRLFPIKIRQTWKPGGEQMAPKLATVTIVLAMALTILTAITSAAPSWSPIFGPQLLLLY